MKLPKVNKLFLTSTILLTVAGFFIFTSASLGLLAKEKGALKDIAFNQIFLGLFLGTIALIVISRIDYRVWRKYSLYIFLFSIALTLLVFVPSLGFEHGGARRWLFLGPISFQPSEFLKLGFIIYFATWLSGIKSEISRIGLGLIPFIILILTTSFLLIQPDTDTFLIICVTGLAMFIAAGCKWRDIIIILLIGIIGFTFIAFSKPYIMQRISTFFNPSEDSLGASYQIQQSLIAIGSGGFSGRGLGQSIQKFGFLPEPIGDSIFAVAAEEFGFLGSVTLIFLFVFFTIQGLRVAREAPDLFGGLVTVGIVILIVSQSFFNIAAMLGIVPLSGMPLLFVSHGGTALFFTLASVGIVLNVSRHRK
ncbi:MAG: putative peptidoglycan glycosyltransferase FtsW [Patescibacteria group bacterium]